MTAISPSQHLDLRRLIDIVPEPLQNRSGQVILKELDSRINSFEESIREGRVTINEGIYCFNRNNVPEYSLIR